MRAAVCTSSLDLGVDFLPAERVPQIGSPKGVARLLQRAGRSGHAPGRPSRITLVPTHSLEIVEGAAARARHRRPATSRRALRLSKPLDVLVQHLVTVALGGGFHAGCASTRKCAAPRPIAGSRARNWNGACPLCAQGGPSLSAYPDYRRAVPDEEGVWRVPDARLSRGATA